MRHADIGRYGGGWRTIRVVDADRGQRAALVELGFGPDLVRRYPSGTRHFDRAVANLRQWLDEMVRQRMTGTAPGWAGALGDLLDRAGQARVPLAVIGSLALAVRGVDVRPGDIDVITTVEGADALGDSYREVLVVPAARAQEGPWPLAAQKWTIASPFEEVSWESRVVRLPPVELQRRTEVRRQRLDRVAAIDDYCTTHRRERQG